MMTGREEEQVGVETAGGAVDTVLHVLAKTHTHTQTATLCTMKRAQRTLCC